MKDLKNFWNGFFEFYFIFCLFDFHRCCRKLMDFVFEKLSDVSCDESPTQNNIPEVFQNKVV